MRIRPLPKRVLEIKLRQIDHVLERLQQSIEADPEADAETLTAVQEMRSGSDKALKKLRKDREK